MIDGQSTTVWRRSERERLLADRMAIDPIQLAAWRAMIDGHIQSAFPVIHEGIVGFCWPYRNEYDARYLMQCVRARGGRTALPVVLAPRAPLEFRLWSPGDPLSQGVYGIPFPERGEGVVPDHLIVPMNGFDREGFRLGYGGGFFDRTLAHMQRRPCTIGVAFEIAAMATLHPQTHDIPMDWIVTEAGVRSGSAAAYRRNSR